MQTTYRNVHRHLRAQRGPASDHTCPCDEPAVEWAYQFTGEELRDSKGRRPHSISPDDYEAMCRKCHEAFDREHDPEMAEFKNFGGEGAGAEAVKEKWATDPEYAGKMRGVLHQNSEAIAERRKTDPEFDGRVREGARKAGAVRIDRMKTDPEFAASVTAMLTANARVRRECNECGLVSNPAGMGNHRRFSGHNDWEYVNE